MDKRKNRYSFQDSANAFLAVILAQILLLIVYSLIINAVSEHTGMPVLDITNTDICMFLNMFLSEAIFFLVYLFYNIATQKSGFKKATRLNKKFDWKIALIVVGLAVVSLFGFNQMTELLNYFLTNICGLNPGTTNFVIDSPVKYVICIFLMAGIPAVFEELVFRGIIFNGLREKLYPKGAVILCAILFALMHLTIYKTFYQLIMGVILSLIIYYTGSITYCFLYHFLNNFMIVTINYITATTGSQIFVYSNWGVSEIIIAVVVTLVATALLGVALYYLGKYCKKKTDFDKDYEDVYGNIEDSDEEANFVAGTDVTGLSEYEIKQLGTTVFITAKGWLILSMVIAGFLWVISSFGI